jgi:DNA-binding NarL/FixJ family response regulator
MIYAGRFRVVAAGDGGLSNDEIAAEIHISPATARMYVSRILTKLGTRDRAQLVVIAYETGLVTPGRH